MPLAGATVRRYRRTVSPWRFDPDLRGLPRAAVLPTGALGAVNRAARYIELLEGMHS